jgi:DNA polymerase
MGEREAPIEPPETFLAASAENLPVETVAAWNELSAEIRACRRCPLGSTRLQAVVYRGSLAPRIVFVGEAPGAAEDRAGRPFVGRAGHRLDAAIATLGLTTSDVGILNLLKCRPPENRFDSAAARVCRPYLDRQLALLRPEVLVPLGAHALRAIDPEAPPILRAAGAPRPAALWAIFPLIHPAATFRSRRLAERWSSDVARLAAWLGSSTKAL